MRVQFALACAIGLACAAAAAAASGPRILVLSNRADLISGGDALVEIKWPAGANVSASRIALNNRDITSAFAQRPNGRYMGLVTGLSNGENLLTVRTARSGSRISITNHPIGGPVFGVGQAPVNPWTTFAAGPGGRPLGPPPVSVPLP